MSDDGKTRTVNVSVESSPRASVTVKWTGDDGRELVHYATGEQLSRLAVQSHALRSRLAERYGASIRSELIELGRDIGTTLVGRENADPLWRWLTTTQPNTFTICSVQASSTFLSAIPWECMVLPGFGYPLVFDPRLRGRFEYVRMHPARDMFPGRPTEPKCLAVWARPRRDELLVEDEVNELRLRFARHPGFRFRWVRDPDLGELRGRLRTECQLLLFAGHGVTSGKGYAIEVGSSLVDAELLLDDINASRAQILIFDCCDSGYGSAARGLPSVLSRLPHAVCLLGFWGSEPDVVSTWHIPALAEQLMLGAHVGKSVSLLRLLLSEQDSDAWFQPVIHIKPHYQPLKPFAGRGAYLEALGHIVEVQ